MAKHNVNLKKTAYRLEYIPFLRPGINQNALKHCNIYVNMYALTYFG